MTPCWVVIFRVDDDVVYLTGEDDWSFDPLDAFTFPTWYAARFAAADQEEGAEIALGWSE